MSSVPHVGEKWERNVAMSEAETREYTMTCCRFSTRCPYATDQCRNGKPDMKDVGNGRQALCFHPIGGE